jgi:hypothetical protein
LLIFVCTYVLIARLQVDVATFIAQLVEGLKDPSYDIKMLAHIMVSRLAHSAGTPPY